MAENKATELGGSWIQKGQCPGLRSVNPFLKVMGMHGRVFSRESRSRQLDTQ